ncbi:MAG TPA: hypothetical protein VLH35_02730, partial [Candidatus Acidoferrales bacterium]|nr:hypothetical protein [Candidatus Acidoferrales bacterium]
VVAVDPSYTIFFLGTLRKRLFCCLRLVGIAVGCILILQAVRLTANLFPLYRNGVALILPHIEWVCKLDFAFRPLFSVCFHV